MKVRVDQDRCQGHTLCAMVAPEVFALDDVDGHASAVEENVPESREAEVRKAAGSCPERAISVGRDTA